MSPKLSFIGLCLTVGLPALVMCERRPLNQRDDPQSCYALNSNPYLKFGLTTSYYVARRKEGITKPKGCSATQLWMISRHGTRYPDIEMYDDLLKLDELKEQVLTNHKTNQRGSLCQMDLDNLEQFKFDLPKDKNAQLTRSGRQELFDLGRHIRDVMPEIFTDQRYTKDKFRFLHSPSERTKESADYFYKGLFGLEFDSQQLPKFENNNNIIYTYSTCPVWKDHSKVARAMHRKSMEGEEMKKVQQSVSKRLGFEEPLETGQIMNIYEACRLNAAFDFGKRSPWCAAFNEDELKFLEYPVDVYFYHKSGPGYDMNKKLSCPAVKDLMDTFSGRVADADNPQPVGSFYFTHHMMIDMVNVGLQITRDSMAPTYEGPNQRQYRTSETMPFGGHILAVLYRCPSNTKKIVFYQNEHTVEYPGCSGEGECDFDTIQKKFNSYVNDPGCTDWSWCIPKEDLKISGIKTKTKNQTEPAVTVVAGLAVSTLLLMAIWFVVKNSF